MRLMLCWWKLLQGVLDKSIHKKSPPLFCYGCRSMECRNLFVLMSLPTNSESRHLDERMTKSFPTHRNPNEYLIFKFTVSNKFNDRLYRGDIKCVVATIMFKVNWGIMKHDASPQKAGIEKFLNKRPHFVFTDPFPYFSFWNYIFLVIFHIKLLSDCFILIGLWKIEFGSRGLE